MKRLMVNRTQCTGCESCVLSCAFEHEDAFELGQSRIRIDRSEEQAKFTPHVCVQCNGRFCIAACPVDALMVDPDLGFIRVDHSLCIKCHACETACPVAGIRFTNADSSPLMCDLCGGNPACVAMCLKPRAIQYVEGGEDRGQ